jgi:cell division inhibitor SulA/protein ImuA
MEKDLNTQPVNDYNLEKLLQTQDIWRGRKSVGPSDQSVSTGFKQLDDLLCGGGWPKNALVELLSAQEGIGELSLLMPALAHLSRGDRWVAWIDPPYIPYAPALAGQGVDLSRILLVRSRSANDRLWALEQALRAGTCAAVLGWPTYVNLKARRRLQLAAERGKSLGFLFYPLESASEASAAAIRLRLEPSFREGQTSVRHSGCALLQELAVSILKRRGGWPVGPVHLPLSL